MLFSRKELNLALSAFNQFVLQRLAQWASRVFSSLSTSQASARFPPPDPKAVRRRLVLIPPTPDPCIFHMPKASKQTNVTLLPTTSRKAHSALCACCLQEYSKVCLKEINTNVATQAGRSSPGGGLLQAWRWSHSPLSFARGREQGAPFSWRAPFSKGAAPDFGFRLFLSSML